MGGECALLCVCVGGRSEKGGGLQAHLQKALKVGLVPPPWRLGFLSWAYCWPATLLPPTHTHTFGPGPF